MLFRRICYLMILLMTLSIPVLGQDSPALFDATFDDNTLPEALKIQYGTYEIADGTLAYTVQNGGFLVIPDGIGWTDYAIETRLNIRSGSVWLQTRTGADLCTGYYLTINPTTDMVDLSSSDRDCNFTVLDTVEPAHVPDAWMVARLEVVGTQIRVWMDGELVIEATDDLYQSGYPTVNVFPVGDDPAQVDFDYIQVTDLTTASSVEATSAPASTAEPEATTAVSPVETTPTSTPNEITPPADAADDEHPTVNAIPVGFDPARMVETLQELDLIPAGDGQLYTGESAIISRVGKWFEPLFEDLIANNIVVGGHIRFLPYADGESCLLSVRIIRDEIGVATRYLDVGLNARNEIFIGETDEDGGYSQATQDGLLSDLEGTFLLIARGDRLTVYVNGRAVFQNIGVTPREGSMGVSSIATTSYTLCQVTDVWAYAFTD